MNVEKYGLSNFSSFLLAILVYCITLFFLFFKINQERNLSIKYTDLQDSFIDIQIGSSALNLQEKTNDKKDKNSEDDLQKLFQQTTNKDFKIQDKNQNEAKLNSLFGDIKDFQEEKSNKVKSSLKSQEKSKQEVDKLLKKLNDNLLIKDNNLSTNNTQEQITGVYDKFLGAIRRNLEQRWRLYEASGNFEVSIKFFIDSDGKFGYTEFSKSYDKRFDDKVLQFLQNLDGKYIALPPSNKKYEIIMKLSDKIKNIGDVK